MTISPEATCVLCGDTFIPTGKQRRRCFKPHQRACGYCGEEFLVKATMKVEVECCSRGCSNRLRAQRASKGKPAKSCVICGVAHEGSGLTCSYKCAAVLRGRTSSTRERECEWCKGLFSPKSSTSKWCERTHYSSCGVCGSDFEVTPSSHVPQTCSSQCAGKLVNSEAAKAKRRATSLKRYGVEHPFQDESVQERGRATMRERYGVDSPLSPGPLREKGRRTSQERYGVEWHAQTEEGKAARAATNRERYGVENPFASEEIKRKLKKTWLENYGVEHPMMNPAVAAGVKATNLERYGVSNVLMVPEIQAKARETFSTHVNSGEVGSRKVSKHNRTFAAHLEGELGVRCKFEERFGSYSADLSIEGTDYLIDLNPTISHNQARAFGCVIGSCPNPCPNHKAMARDYHLKRAEAARAEGKRLVQWYGWQTKEELVAFLRGRLAQAPVKLSARKCEVVKLSPTEANSFLAEVHVQGAGRGQSHCYGLRHGGELVAVATFGGARFGGQASHEFIRFAVAPTHRIWGGASYLFREFLREAAPEAVVSYVDYNHSTADSLFLDHLGFGELAPTGPAVVWHSLLTGKRVASSSLVRQGADRLLGTSYGKPEACGLTNEAIMLLEGFLPVATAGNRRYLWEAASK